MSSTTRRHWFGGSANDYAASLSGSNLTVVARPDARLWAWTTAEDGVRITDLLNESLVGIDELITDASGNIPRFQARTGDTQIWLGAAEGGARTLLMATDLDEDVAAVEEAVDGIAVIPGETAGGVGRFWGRYPNFESLPTVEDGVDDNDFAIVIVE